ncbi:MAG TPA: hypothetical protein VII38_09105 [Polyangia bacterium]
MRTHTLVAALTLAAAVVVSSPAEARHVRFLGPHPIAARHGGGYCYIEGPHIHAYAPDRAALYQQVGDEYVFTGDPTPFGYDGPRHVFYGHHPILTATGQPVYCLINGPHYHAFAAPEGPQYKMQGDVAFYIGPPLPAPPREVRVVNAEYRPFVTFRPTVEVQPPPEWHGEVVVSAPGVVVGAPGVVVGAPPSVRVYAPRPRVDVEVSAPGVVFAPPPPVVVGAPGVVFGAPGVVVGAPRPAYYGGGGVEVRGGGRGHHDHGHDSDWGHREDDRGHGGFGHHDNGKHNGWGKH